MNRKKLKMRGQMRVFLVILLVFMMGGLAFFLISRVNKGVITTGTMQFDQKNIQSVVIRDEYVKTGEAYGQIYLAREGALVTSGDTVTQVYKYGYNENVVQELVALQQEIKQYQINTIFADISNPELNAIQDEIDALLQQIAEAKQKTPSENMLSLQTDLNKLLEKRREFLKTAAQPDGKLTQLIDTEENYMKSLQEWQSDETTPSSGRISFYFDSYETLLNKETIGQIMPNDLDAVKKKKKAQITVTNKDKPLFRIMKPDMFYIAIATSKSKDFVMVKDEIYQLQFNGLYDHTYQGRVISAVSGINGNVYVLQIDDDVAPFTNVRVVSLQAQTGFSGLKAPKSAVVYQDEIPGLIIDHAGVEQFVAIELLCEDRDNVLFRTKGNVLSPGMKFIERKIKLNSEA